MGFVRALTAVMLAAVAGTAALAADPAAAVTVNCNVERYSMVFRPGSGDTSLASMDFYRLTRTFPRTALLGSIDRTGGGTFVPRCRKLATPRRTGRVARARSTRRATTLRCGFAHSPRIYIHPISNNDEELGIHVLVGARTVIFAQLFDHRAPRVTFDRRYCRRAALPD